MVHSLLVKYALAKLPNVLTECCNTILVRVVMGAILAVISCRMYLQSAVTPF